MTNEPFRHRLAEPRRTPKKNVSCFFDLAGVKFFLKMERTFFFGVLPSKYSGSAWGFNTDEVLEKLFFGERICQNFGSFVFEFGCRKWKRRVWGGIFHLLRFLFWGNSGRGSRRTETKRQKQYQRSIRLCPP